MAKEKIFVQIGEKVIELKGADLEAFYDDKAKMQAELKAQKTELEAQKQLKISAYTKLGLTEEEINAIL
jgi:hypothetical protein